MLTTLVCQHLSEKLNPVFPMLNQVEGVSGSEFILKQGGDNADKKQTLKEQPQPKQKTNNHQEQKPKVHQKGNEAFGSKGK